MEKQRFLFLYGYRNRFDKLTTYGGAGYWINSGSGNKNSVFAGWEVQYDFSPVVTLVANCITNQLVRLTVNLLLLLTLADRLIRVNNFILSSLLVTI